jgi:hypothetical protein
MKLIIEGRRVSNMWEIDRPTVETLAMVLASCEHEQRMVRTNSKDPRNIPFKRLNQIGDDLGDTLELE